MTSPIVFVDTETTGLDPERHEIWEVACIYMTKESASADPWVPRWLERSWQLPVDLGRADSVALDIGRFHERYRNHQVYRLDRFATEFADITRGKHLAGAVASFDEERLRKLLRANGACPEWHYHLVDVEALAAGHLASGVVLDSPHPRDHGISIATPPWDSEELSRALGVDPDTIDRHTALGDARWAKAIYEAVMS